MAQVKVRQVVQEVAVVAVMTHRPRMDFLEPQTQAAVVVELDAVAQVVRAVQVLFLFGILPKKRIHTTNPFLHRR